ncbi:MAG TPA: hypothetical protein VL947_02860, partial [Cytophagales bacterium]|nr:hypothetical protein [Cytophagales bacterium]
GYTLSWATQKYAEVNNGKEFYAKYDARNDLSVVAIYEINKRITISGTWVYNTGYPVNPPISEYKTYSQDNLLGNIASMHGGQNFSTKEEYAERNSIRMPSYHRFDLGIQFSKQKERYLRTFELSVYNLYSRQNPFFYMVEQEYLGGNTYKSSLKQISIFPIIPSVSWSFKF